MIQSVIHTSENNNLYIYDDQHRLSMLVHPELEKAYNKLTDTDPYYLKKYEYLVHNGFFAKPQIADFRTLEESTVRDNITNSNQVVFEVTDSCNLNCTYCALGDLYEGFDERSGTKINTRYAINLLKYIFDLKPKYENNKLIISFYGGEALLNMRFIRKIVEVSNQLNIGKKMKLEYTMTTNATLIHRYIDFLVENKFRLLISLDGNEINHSYRTFGKNRKNSFCKVIENIDMIQKYYPEYFSSHINFNAVLHNRNSVKEINEFIYNRYRKIPRIAELNRRDIKSENKDILEKIFHNKRKSEAEYLKNSDLSIVTHGNLSLFSELTSFLKFYSVNYYISNISALLHTNEEYLPTTTCTPFSKKIFLTNHGKILPCEKINYKYVMGIVNEDIDIDIQKITREYNFYYDNLKKHCQSCYAYKFCGTCLFQLNNIDNVNEDKFICNNFYDQKDFRNKLYRIFSFLEKYPNDFTEILDTLILE